NYERPLRHASRGTHAGLAAGSEYATDAGLRISYRGGNAVDVGVAIMFAAAVTEYSHFGFGGEAPILVRTADGKVHSIAGVGTMPKLATPELFRTRRLMPGEITSPPEKGGLKGMVPVAGLMPALVPGMVDAGLVALREYGTKSFGEVIATAIDLADGAPIDEMRAGAIDRSRRFFELWPASKQHFMPDGRVPMPGEIFRQPDLARTLRAMADAEKKALAGGANRVGAIDAVRDYFYRGDIARKIDAFSKENRGLLRYEDMAAFRLQPEDAVVAHYKGYEVYKPGFWSQGPAMVETLNMLDGFDLAGMKWNSADYIHTLNEALKLAYADRDTYYGDPKFAHVPMERLLSMQYAGERRKLIGPLASLEFRPGKIGDHPPPHPSESEMTRLRIDDALMARDTTCVDAIDGNGMMFSSTPSGAWLPSVIAGDTGIPLTERAQSFLLVPGSPNELEGGKRPRVTLSPTLVTHGGKPYLALSTPGGDNQEQSLLQILLDVIEFGMGTEFAIEAPRFQTRHLVSSFDNHAMNPGDLLLDERIPPEVALALGERKHRIGTRSRWASGAAPVLIRVTPGGVIEAAADPYGYRSAQAW
ncbi:MAG: gamma-glutamyltransferase, partial [Acidobacteriota bacterium]|nr:gamma-glutamyltransferase [Acidobacteriota bacterium]